MKTVKIIQLRTIYCAWLYNFKNKVYKNIEAQNESLKLKNNTRIMQKSKASPRFRTACIGAIMVFYIFDLLNTHPPSKQF